MGRRGNGEGTVYKDPRRDRWVGQIMLGGHRHSVYGKTAKEVRRKLRELAQQADLGVIPSPEKLTLRQFAERWLEDVVRHAVRPNTRRNYADLFRLYVLPALGDMKLREIQPAHIQGLYSDLLDRGLSSKTVRLVHAAIHKALAQATSWHLVPRNVAELAEPPKLVRKEIVALSAEQARQLLEACRGSRWEALIALALGTGMRQSELLGLRWEDLDLDAGVVHVRRQLTRDGAYSEPKSARGKRRLSLPQSVVEVLREHRRQQLADRLLVGPDWEDHGLVFCCWHGRPLNHRNVVRAFRSLLQKANLPHVPFHALRHTHATLLLSAGVHPKVVQERLGHSSIAMTLDIYSHAVPSLDREAAASLNTLLA